MGIEVWRDWIIVIQGIIQILLLLLLIIMALVLYSKINSFIKRGKETLYNVEYNVEKKFASPYYRTGSWVVGWIAEAIWKKKENKSGKE